MKTFSKSLLLGIAIVANKLRWVLKISFVRFWIYFRGKIGSKRGSVASYVTDFTYDLGRKETKR